jgi:hypothetical protein
MSDSEIGYTPVKLENMHQILSFVDLLAYFGVVRDEVLASIHTQDTVDLSEADTAPSSKKRPMDVVPTIDQNTVVILASADYFRRLNALLEKTPPNTLYWYLVWRVIHQLGPELDTETSLLAREVGALVSGIHAYTEPRAPGCVAWIERAFSPLIARYFGLHILTGRLDQSDICYTRH